MRGIGKLCPWPVIGPMLMLCCRGCCVFCFLCVVPRHREVLTAAWR
jgi:hypothetical protein